MFLKLKAEMWFSYQVSRNYGNIILLVQGTSTGVCHNRIYFLRLKSKIFRHVCCKFSLVHENCDRHKTKEKNKKKYFIEKMNNCDFLC